MSYYGYNYAPYFQQQNQQSAGNDHQGQDSQRVRNSPHHQSEASATAQRTHTTTNSYSPHPASQSYHPTHSYQQYGTSNGTRSYSGQAVHGYSGGSTPYYNSSNSPNMDTSGLRNLAHASAFGRNSPSVGHTTRSQYQSETSLKTESPSYTPNSTMLNNYQPPPTDNRGSNTTASSTTKEHPQLPYASSIAANALAQSRYYDRLPSHQYSETVEPQPRGAAHHANQASEYMASKPSDHHGNNLSKYQGTSDRNDNQITQQSPGYQPNRMQEQRHARPLTTIQQYPDEDQNVPRTFPNTTKGNILDTNHSPRSTSLSRLQEHPSPKTSIHDFHITSTQIGINRDSARSANSDRVYPPSPVQLSQPSTVDPSQVFNQYEYQRRKAAAEAEAAAARKATRDAVQREHNAVLAASKGIKESDSPLSTVRPNTLHDSGTKEAVRSSSVSIEKHRSIESGSKGQIEAEIKAMIEKMREYKAKDPAVFSEVWEQFKKVQPAARSSSQAPQASKELQLSASANSIETASPDFRENSQDLSPDLVLAEPDIPFDNAKEELPDLGKFPFFRRRRGKVVTGRSIVRHPPSQPPTTSATISTPTPATFHPASASRSAPSGVESSQIASSTAQLGNGLMLQPTHSVRDSSQHMNMAIPSESADEAMQRAMQAFHSNPNSTSISRDTSHPVEPAPVAPLLFPESIPQSRGVHYSSPYVRDTSAAPVSSTIWPEDKKSSLALVAKTALEADVENVGKSITTDEIRGILDRNPSYDQLCHILEGSGFKFERRALARLLLAAVPTEPNQITPNNRTTESLSKVSVARSIADPITSTNPQGKSPGRPRGRPRKDGLPPIQRHSDQARPAQSPEMKLGIPLTASFTVENKKLHAGQHSPISKSVSTESTRPNGTERPSANISRPPQSHRSSGAYFGKLVPGHLRSPIPKINGSHPGSKEMPAPVAGFAGKDIRWSNAHPGTPKSLSDVKKNNPETGRITGSDSMAGPSVNGIHLEFGSLDHSGVPSAAQSLQNIQQKSRSLPDSSSANTIPQIPVSKPVSLTKEQMARKRNFSDIVDLTNNSDEEDADWHKRIRRDMGADGEADTPTVQKPNSDLQSVAKENEILASERTTMNDRSDLGMHHKDQPKYATESKAIAPAAVMKGNVDLSRFKATDKGSSPKREALRMAAVVKPLNEKYALRRSKYDIKTIARDILISKGIHPAEKPLNWHLKPLLQNFSQVTQTSDLSTFKWHLVDPGGPPPKEAVTVDIDDHDADDEADHQLSPSAARQPQVLITADGHTQMMDTVAGNNAPKPKLAPTHGRGHGARGRGVSLIRSFARINGLPNAVNTSDNESAIVDMMRSSLGTRGRPRGRARGRGISIARHQQSDRTRPDGQPQIPVTTVPNNGISPPSIPSFGDNRSATTPSRSTDRQADTRGSTDLSQLGAGATTTGLSGNRNTPAGGVSGSSFVVRVPSIAPASAQSIETPTKRRGRPPGSTQKSSTSGSERSPSVSTSGQPKRRGRPPGSKNVNAPRQPSSLRHTVPEDGIGVMVPSSSPSASSRFLPYIEPAKADPSKRRKHKAARVASTPRYQIFDCRWKDCRAELHNLETLRKHVYKVHGRHKKALLEDEPDDSARSEDGGLKCLWQGCGNSGNVQVVIGDLSAPIHFEFESEESWKKHIEDKHFVPLAWELGDGPSTHPSDVEPSSYLSDSQGRQVTPLARTHGPPDTLPLGSSPSVVRAYHRAHGNVTDLQKAQAVLNSHGARKEAIGVVIERKGCTLVTPGMRSLLKDQDSGEEEDAGGDKDSDEDSSDEEASDDTKLREELGQRD